jgi:hypothetical protein
MPFRQENVFRFNVAMDDPLSMSVAERVCHLPRNADRILHRKRPLSLQPLAEALTPDQRHREPELIGRLTRIDHAQDVRMLKTSREVDFLLETVGAQRRGDFGMQDLERNRPFVPQIVGEKNGREAAASELALYAVILRKRSGKSSGVHYSKCRPSVIVGVRKIARYYTKSIEAGGNRLERKRNSSTLMDPSVTRFSERQSVLRHECLRAIVIHIRARSP